MAAITIHIPDSLLLTSDGSVRQFEERCRFLLALKYFEMGQLSSGQAAAMCGLNRADFILEAGRAGVPVLNLTEDELEKELRHAHFR
jgi:hypothetical protein